MFSRIAVLGHIASIEEIEATIKLKFPGTEVIGISLGSDEEADAAAERLAEVLPQCCGVLYTRHDPYCLMISRVDHGDTPVRYVDIDGTSFLRSLLEASVHYKVDITRASVDTLAYETIEQAYRSIGVTDFQVKTVAVDSDADHFVEMVIAAHRKNYQTGAYATCVTNIRNVHDILREENIPCVLMSPSRDTYIYEIRRLLVSHQLQRGVEGAFAVMSIASQVTSEQHLLQSSPVQSVLDRNRVSELVTYFAQRIGGLCVRVAGEDYLVLCAYEQLAAETDGFTKLQLLESVFLNTPFALSVGIGVGSSLQALAENARVGLRRALADGGNRAYVVYAPQQIVGPIEPNESKSAASALFDRKLALAAEACGLAVGSVFKIDTFARQKHDRSFTIPDLSTELGCSVRTASRLILKLEKNGYIVEVGRTTTGERGRPTRIFRLMW